MSHVRWSERRGALQSTVTACRVSARPCRKNALVDASSDRILEEREVSGLRPGGRPAMSTSMRIALVFDCDGTIAEDTTTRLLRHVGLRPNDFWADLRRDEKQ